MSSVVSESSSRTWWFSSKISRPGKDLRRSFSQKSTSSKPPSSGLKFNTITSALRLTKKHPSLTIQEPPPPLPPQPRRSSPLSSPPDHDATPRANTRPQSNSLSTLRSSLEPRTPSDAPRDTLHFRQSLMTLSDSDPFASRGISIASYPPDLVQKSEPTLDTFSPLDRSSYTSSSSQSPTDIWWRNTFASSGSHDDNKPPNRLQDKSISPKHDRSDSQLSTPLAKIHSIPKSASTSTLTDGKGRIDHSITNSDVPDEDPSNSRKSSQDVPANLSSTSVPTSPSQNVAPRQSPPRSSVLRKSSLLRASQPPKAPPTHNLPLPPATNSSNEDLSSYIIPSDIASSSSSVLSFAASHSTDDDTELNYPSGSRYEKGKNHFLSPHDSRSRREDWDWDRESSHLPKSSVSACFLPRTYEVTRTIKKAASHQSFSSRQGVATGPGSISSFVSDEGLEKPPQKSRSFHHHRFRQPLRHKTPTFATAASHMESRESPEKRRPNTAGSSRRRLFSGSSLRRPSTAQSDRHEHDARSLFSLPLESERKRAKTPSLYMSEVDDPDQPSSAPVTRTDYVPKRILSPAEMLKVEASVRDTIDDSAFVRQRGLSSSSSLLTSHSSDSSNDFAFPSALSPPSSIHAMVEQSESSSLRGLPVRSASVGSKALSSRQSHKSAKSPQLYSPPSSPALSSLPHSPLAISPERVLMSLPPPPRPRPRPPTADFSVPNSPRSTPITPPPPLRPILRSIPSLESTILRRAIMKKPSFLDIEDECDSKPVNDSFLDLKRDSFDIVPDPDD